VPRPVVTFTSDFGAGSGYPAQMKGEVLRRLPDATLVDVSHEVPPFDVLGGALLLEACVPRFPVEAVHLAVVDPGVGTSRRPVCVVDREGRRLVGPDNGLFTPFLEEGARCFLLSDPAVLPPDPSPTFHGRDLFAPAAAWIAAGGDPARLGPAVLDPVRLEWPRAVLREGAIAGLCLAADPFGNLVTSIRAADAGGRALVSVEVAGRPARPVTTFGEGVPGELVAYWGSAGRLEVAVREGSAARDLGAGRGAPVRVVISRAGAPATR
jgi:hypothetical protein